MLRKHFILILLTLSGCMHDRTEIMIRNIDGSYAGISMPRFESDVAAASISVKDGQKSISITVTNLSTYNVETIKASGVAKTKVIRAVGESGGELVGTGAATFIKKGIK